MKKFLISIMILFMFAILAGCKKDNPKDTTAPIFQNIEDGKLPPLKIEVNENVDLYAGISAIDDSKEEVKLDIINLDTINFAIAGNYELVYQATDKSGNIATATRELVIQKSPTIVTVEYQAIVINDKGSKYVFNSDSALKYTSSGASFRMSDQIQVMEKSFFLEQYKLHKTSYAKNGEEIFFPYGALIIIDLEGDMKLLRASSSPVEIDASGKIQTVTFTTTQSIDKQGIFKDIENLVNNLIPNGGYIVFAPNRDDNNAKKFILQNLFDENFSGGAISANDYNMNPQDAIIKLDDHFKEEVIENGGITEVMGKVNKTEYIYDGISLATYNYGDGKKKPVIFFFHGFGGDHTSGIMDKGETLAQKGFFVVAIDAYLHGDRMPEKFKELSYGQKQKEIVNIQIQTAKDAMYLYEKYFKNDERVLAKEVYAFGVSMGAGSAFYLATIMKEVKAIVSIVGSPSFYDFYQEKQEFYGWTKDDYYNINLEYYQQVDPLINYGRLKDVYIYMGNGSKDTTVPKKFAEDLATKLNSSMYVYEVYDCAHTSTPEMLESAYNFLLKYK